MSETSTGRWESQKVLKVTYEPDGTVESTEEHNRIFKYDCQSKEKRSDEKTNVLSFQMREGSSRLNTMLAFFVSPLQWSDLNFFAHGKGDQSRAHWTYGNPDERGQTAADPGDSSENLT